MRCMKNRRSQATTRPGLKGNARGRVFAFILQLCWLATTSTGADLPIRLPDPANEIFSPSGVEWSNAEIPAYEHWSAGTSGIRNDCDQQTCGQVVQLLPNSLLYSPPLANPWEPRIYLKATTLQDEIARDTLEAAVGGTFGLLRINPFDQPTDGIQFDAFAVVFNRFFALLSSGIDYRYGFPVTFRRGPWSGKIGWEHKCSHVGDGLFFNAPGVTPSELNRDDLVVALSRDFDFGLRVYGVFATALGFPFGDTPVVHENPTRFNFGMEWSRRRSTGLKGQPFGALDIDFRSTQNNVANFSGQIGWQWRNHSLRSFRVALEYFSGRSPFGKFYQVREEWIGVGTYLDF